MDAAGRESGWARAAQVQQSKDIWQNDGVLTDFQRWTIYRICTRTLNLYHAGWPTHRNCSYSKCSTRVETIEHIVWGCARAKQVWMEWLPHWLGHYLHRDELTALMQHLASREAPPLSPNFIEEASKSIPQWVEEHNEAMQIICLIWTTSTQCTLWLIRIKEIFEAEKQSVQRAKHVLWKSAEFQTQAVIRGMVSQPATRHLGFMVAQCYAVFVAMQPSDRPLVLHSWTLIFHSKKRAEGRKGAWILLGNALQKVSVVGVIQKEQMTEIRMAQELIAGAIAERKTTTPLSTVKLDLFGTQKNIQASRVNPKTRQGFKEIALTTWTPIAKELKKAVEDMVKSQPHVNDGLGRGGVTILNKVQTEISKNRSQSSATQNRFSIRQSLQRYQDSIV